MRSSLHFTIREAGATSAELIATPTIRGGVTSTELIATPTIRGRSDIS